MSKPSGRVVVRARQSLLIELVARLDTDLHYPSFFNRLVACGGKSGSLEEILIMVLTAIDEFGRESDLSRRQAILLRSYITDLLTIMISGLQISPEDEDMITEVVECRYPKSP